MQGEAQSEHHILEICMSGGRERKNMNLPGVIVDLPTLTKKDEEDLVKWGIPNDIDFIAASFVRKGEDLDNIHRVSIRGKAAFLYSRCHD